MGFMDDLKKLTKPYTEDDDDFDEFDDDARPSRPSRSSSAPKPSYNTSFDLDSDDFSATGSTKTAAEAIAAATGGDLLELEPAEPYTSADLDYNSTDSRVSREHDDETLRDVALKTTTADNWADYDPVYIGYPIWWGIAAWPVDDFVTANDFTGKTVIPFCTSASSGLGESGELLAEMAGTGDWLEGQRFPSRVSREDVQTWLDGLGL